MDPKTAPPQDAAPLPRGIVLFQADTNLGHRRRRTIFLVLSSLIASMVLWPVFPRFAGIFPLVLGLPLSLAWVVLALLAMFSALLGLFLTENPGDDPGDGHAKERGDG